MKTFKFVSLALALCLALVSLLGWLVRPAFEANAATQPLAGEDTPTDQLIVKYKDAPRTPAVLEGPQQTEAIDRLSNAAGIDLAYLRPMSGDAHVLKLPAAFSEGEVAAIAARLTALPEVEYAEPDPRLFPVLEPNDTNYLGLAQWSLFSFDDPRPAYRAYGVNALAAWDITTGSAGIIVAVIDTGITDHHDLAGRTVPGYDFIADVPTANDGNGRDNDPHDPGDWLTAEEIAQNPAFTGCSVRSSSSWHGTHVAGTVGAATNNGVGVAGINWNSKILPVRALGKCGGYSSDIADGIRWAAGLDITTTIPANQNPAQVINLSLGSKGSCLTIYQNAIDDAVAAGATVVISAGNDGADSGLYRPGNCNGVITVAATDRAGALASYSNFGTAIEISAPGGSGGTGSADAILSTWNRGQQGPVYPTDNSDYAYYTGTSMSAPHVAGVASLLLSRNPNLAPVEVLQILQKSATVFPTVSACPVVADRPANWCQCTTAACGSGIVNAGDALSLPYISTLSYAPFTTGVTETELTVHGANFFISSTVMLSGSPLTTTFVDSQELHATLTLSDVTGSGGRLVAVRTVLPSGIYTSTAQGLYRLYLPAVQRQYNSSGWETLVSENFEGAFPSGLWQIGDNTVAGYTWGKSACKAFAGSHSAWVLAGGAKGPAGCGSSYANSMDSRMTYGPFSLTGASAAHVQLQLWMYTEALIDEVCVVVSKDALNFFGNCYSGNVGAWTPITLDLSNIKGENFLGASSVSVRVFFHSDATTVRPEGAFVDDFVLRKCTAAQCETTRMAPVTHPELFIVPVDLLMEP
ncbi:MAG: S8 family peptidase [Chloroflexota bacterium]